MNSYQALAEVYEKLINDCDYEKWSQYLLKIIKKYAKSNYGLDLACGSGKITRFLSENGYAMTGADISEEMLAQAKRLSDEKKLAIRYFKSDLNNLRLPEKYDFVTAINDAFNYVKGENLLKCFKNVNKILYPQGLFVFDVSSEYKLREVIGNNMFGEDYPDVSYLWFNELKDDGVAMDLSFFIKRGELYEKKEEKHFQYAHSVSFVSDCLKKAGFTILSVDEFGEEINEKSLRINFTAVKNG